MHGTSDTTADFEPPIKTGPVSDIDTRLVRVSFFQNKSAQSLRTADLTLSELRDQILATTAASKMQLPLLKLAIFGGKLSALNCFRTDDNLNEITGIETDYDDGEISFDNAVADMQKARLRCLLYSSASHTPEKPRWRILLPTSRNCPPARREKLVAVINGLFGGRLAGESFTLSTAFFYGSVNNNPAHRAIVLDGDFIDLRDDLYAGSIYKDGSRVGGKVGEDPADGFDQESPRVSGDDPYADRGLIAAALAVIANADLSWVDWNRVGMAAHRATRSTGFDAFDMWSKKSKKYNEKTTTARWHSFSMSPPNKIGAPTICQMADEASPGWRERHNDAEVRRIFENMAKRARATDSADAGAGASAGAGGTDAGEDWDAGADAGAGAEESAGAAEDNIGAGDDTGAGENASAGDAGPDADDGFAVPPPVDLWAKFGPPSLAPGMLPNIIEDYAVAQGRAMGADIAGIAVAAIAVCTAAIPDKIQLQVKKHNTGWLEQSRLWFALVGPPSTMKTPIISAAVAPLMKIDSEMARKNSEARARYDKLPAKEKRQTDPPKQTQLMLQDTTIEAAQEIFKDSPDGLLCYQDELSGFFGAMDKYSGARGASKDRAFWLQSYNGGAYSVHRIGRGAIYIPNLSAGILGGIQPDAIRKVAAECVDDGLLQRLLPIILQPAVLGQDEPLSEVDPGNRTKR